jgi:hypothetical protein
MVTRRQPTRRQVEVLRAYIRTGLVAAAAYRRTGCVNAAQAAYWLGVSETGHEAPGMVRTFGRR